MIGEATRPIYWNIGGIWVMYLLFGLAMAAFAYGLWRRVRFWRAGKADGERLGEWGRRFWLLVKELLGQTRVRGSRLPGVFHSLIFYSFLVLVVTTAVVALDADLHTSFFRGWLYLTLSTGAELGGALILVGVGMAAWRRFVRRPETLTRGWADAWPLALVGLMTLTGFLVEGLRIAEAGDAWRAFTPVGWGAGLMFAGLDADAATSLHRVLWWGHTALAFAWIASIPYTKFMHLLSLPANVFFQKLRPRGELRRVDIMELLTAEDFDPESFSLGVQTAADFTWKQRLDFDACVECGRCEEVCPSTQAGHPFSPRQFIAGCLAALDAKTNGGGPPAIVGAAFDQEFIWHCRTCMACMEVCPACIDHVDSLVEVRRNEVLVQGRMPAEARDALKLLESAGNPFGPQNDRVEWVRELGVPVIPAGGRCDVLFWIGCCIAFDPTKRRIAEDLCRLLDRCGLDWGILGEDERCCGDPARVLGEERLFQDIAKAQIEQIRSRDFQVLLTSCPHCYNVLKNEYPQFGGDFNVVHHSEFLHEMIWSGELRPRPARLRRAVYHDPCYLGRYQKIYDAPRQVLASLAGCEVTEMRDAQERSLCCGGGGGHFWMDLKEGERINNLRVRQAKEAGADTIVTACAYCKQMLDDSVKLTDLDDTIEVVDIGSLVLESLEGREERAGGEDAAEAAS